MNKVMYKTLNGKSVELTEKQELFVSAALRKFPDIKTGGTITRKQAFEVYVECNAGHPKWLKTAGLKAGRGSYFLPVNKVASKAPVKAQEPKEPEAKESEPASNDDFEKELAANGIEV